MKKILSLLLACMMLFLTACNQTLPSETTASDSQNQEKPKDSELKDTIIRKIQKGMLELPSRVLFEQNTSSTSPNYIFYYSKADGKAYVYCFDPLCDHAGGKCLAYANDLDKNLVRVGLTSMFFINNRFYGATQSGNIFSFAFDGSDLKLEYDSGYQFLDNMYIWYPNFSAYDKYIYIYTYADENEKEHTLRFDTETKELENLTEKTGNFIMPIFFYNGEIYGRSSRLLHWIKTDLNLTEVEIIDEIPVSDYIQGSIFYKTAYNDEKNYADRKAIGIGAYDMKTGETKVITHEMLGLEEYPPVVFYVDENYIYFYQSKKSLVGTYIDPRGKEQELYRRSDGKLYRVKHDGTECICIYDNPDFEFSNNESETFIYENKLILRGYYIGVRNGVATTWDSALKVGIMGPDGKIDKFENIELVY